MCENILEYSTYGVLRALPITGIVYPIDLVKTKMHATDLGIIEIVKETMAKGGCRGFYKGVSYRLKATIRKQIWVWPMILGIPKYLREKEVSPLTAQAMTGSLIATVDTISSFGLDRKRIGAVLEKKVMGEKWKGILSFYLRAQSSWVPFLVAAAYFRGEEKRTFRELVWITVEVAVTVSVIQAPFDRTNTLSQIGRLTIRDVLGQKALRGWHLNAASLLIQNLASLILINQFS